MCFGRRSESPVVIKPVIERRSGRRVGATVCKSNSAPEQGTKPCVWRITDPGRMRRRSAGLIAPTYDTGPCCRAPFPQTGTDSCCCCQSLLAGRTAYRRTASRSGPYCPPNQLSIRLYRVAEPASPNCPFAKNISPVPGIASRFRVIRSRHRPHRASHGRSRCPSLEPWKSKETIKFRSDRSGEPKQDDQHRIAQKVSESTGERVSAPDIK
jgi:hypothetical protein